MVAGRWIVAGLLVSRLALADDCRREADGRVSCDSEGFALLVGTTQNARADAARCAADLQLATNRLALAQAVVEPPPAPAPAPAAPRSSILPLVGYAVGVAGAVALGVAGAGLLQAGLEASPLTLALTGLVTVGVGAVLVTW